MSDLPYLSNRYSRRVSRQRVKWPISWECNDVFGDTVKTLRGAVDWVLFGKNKDGGSSGIYYLC